MSRDLIGRGTAHMLHDLIARKSFGKKTQQIRDGTLRQADWREFPGEGRED